MMTDYQQLLQAVERYMHHSLTAPSDFKWLSQEIGQRTKENLSAMTLMRLWGYVPGCTPRKVTLDIVARSIGYMGFDDFMQQQGTLPEGGVKVEEDNEAEEAAAPYAEATGKRLGKLW